MRGKFLDIFENLCKSVFGADNDRCVSSKLGVMNMSADKSSLAIVVHVVHCEVCSDGKTLYEFQITNRESLECETPRASILLDRSEIGRLEEVTVKTVEGHLLPSETVVGMWSFIVKRKRLPFGKFWVCVRIDNKKDIFGTMHCFCLFNSNGGVQEKSHVDVLIRDGSFGYISDKKAARIPFSILAALTSIDDRRFLLTETHLRKKPSKVTNTLPQFS